MSFLSNLGGSNKLGGCSFLTFLLVSFLLGESFLDLSSYTIFDTDAALLFGVYGGDGLGEFLPWLFSRSV